MVAFDIPFAFVAAGALGWRAEGRRPDLALLFVGAGVAAPGTAFLERYPDWDWQYFVDPSTLPAGTTAAFVAAVMIAGFLGHRAGLHSPRTVGIVAVLLGLFTLVTLPRTLYVADRATFLAGEAPMFPMEFIVFAAPWILLAGLIFGVCAWGSEKARQAAGT